ncbi:hypothetical protein ACJMK2_005134 [Sinanodonta woodiana]|uniref:Uncharacterized protein n=1 Tax=Sinanodonta woodiana TaxID=1069815 RepID=A0ABD3VS83_SINWO
MLLAVCFVIEIGYENFVLDICNYKLKFLIELSFIMDTRYECPGDRKDTPDRLRRNIPKSHPYTLLVFLEGSYTVIHEKFNRGYVAFSLNHALREHDHVKLYLAYLDPMRDR